MASWEVILAEKEKPEITWGCDRCFKLYTLKIENSAYKEINAKSYFMFLRYFVYSENTDIFIDICEKCSNIMYNDDKHIKAVYKLKQEKKNEQS